MFKLSGGGRVVRWCWINFQCRAVILIWIIVRQGSIALAIGAGGGGLDVFFSPQSFLFSFSLSLGGGPIQTEILSQRAVKPQNNQSAKSSTVYSNMLDNGDAKIYPQNRARLFKALLA